MTMPLRSLLPLLVALALTACGGAEDARAPLAPGGGGGAGGESGDPTTGCDEGASESCKVVIHQASGVTSCWEGAKVCVDGTWSDCVVSD